MEGPYYAYLKNKVLVKPEHLPKLMNLVSKKQIKKNTILLSAGQVCKNMFFVEKGLLRLYSIDANGKEHIIQFASENWFISERDSLYFGTPSRFFIDALEESALIVFDQAFIDQAATISHEFRTYNEYLLQNHIRQLQKRIDLLIGASAETRYVEFISLYPNLTLRITHWKIASFFRLYTRILSRARKGMAQ